MIFRRILQISLLIVVLTGCAAPTPPPPTATLTPPPTPTLAQPGVSTTSVPDARLTAAAYLDAWKADRYADMYAMLTSVSRAARTEEEFTKQYRSVSAEAALGALDYQLLSSLVLNPHSAQVGYRVTLKSTLVGDITRETLMNLTLENGAWRVQWDDNLIMPELAGGNYLGMERFIPARANIYDRQGQALVAQTDVTAIGLIPDLIDPDQEDDLFTWLVRLTGLPADEIRYRYSGFPAGAGWYLPLGEVSADQIARYYNVLSGFSGLVLNPYKARYYFDGGIAPHVLGYVSPIQAGQEDQYLRQGYALDERVGQDGLEAWGEPYLSGKRGGALYVFNSQGQIVTRLGETQAQPAQAIYTTIDRAFQKDVQRTLEGFRGAAVVIEVNTGRVIAMASSPAFDSNAFEPRNYNFGSQLEDIYGNPDLPLYNRATRGQYPLGSVFKIITMAAALESGEFKADTVYNCGYFFDELGGGTILNDWTYTRFLEDGEMPPSGPLTLVQGLMRSCNPWFWHIGLSLYNLGLTTKISEMARGFGLGQPTGIVGLGEERGQVPEPASPLDATNQAIGQGALLVTPLQVAAFTAAVANGGTIYRPQIIEKIAPPDGEATFSFKPEISGKLPISPENLGFIREGMRGVISSRKPRGTAYHRFVGLNVPLAGKTGSATSGSILPHSWFAGFSEAGREDKPDIAVVVIVENEGEGSDFAAPIVRRIFSLYFTGTPGPLFPWESGLYVRATPPPAEEPVSTPAP